MFSGEKMAFIRGNIGCELRALPWGSTRADHVRLVAVPFPHCTRVAFCVGDNRIFVIGMTEAYNPNNEEFNPTIFKLGEVVLALSWSNRETFTVTTNLGRVFVFRVRAKRVFVSLLAGLLSTRVLLISGQSALRAALARRNPSRKAKKALALPSFFVQQDHLKDFWESFRRVSQL